ncbi:carboxylesterase/lipase family protein [Actinopolymorpha pittospori]|uniref:Carboxylic ester hydrolase n=1 Tax=Actinopolymorpha pittospori TaxID=648752 RepID=A0A927N5C9_9ACTN|nr:carboxylesterase family protein [Actinopolymorpha pittospori]MBE1612419.1 para-nitrobenzyl esterase [Actinopolymorpha pittospori]
MRKPRAAHWTVPSVISAVMLTGVLLVTVAAPPGPSGPVGPNRPDGGPSSSGPVAMTDRGLVRGTSREGYQTFQGIPYAAPPVGERRWTAPRPAPAWRGIRDGTTPGSPCPQGPSGEITCGSVEEDCLFVNVTTPAAGSSPRPRPVMVWLHGGGYSDGAASSYDAHRLAVQGDVVVVTVNYRLGIFGFLAHPGLAGSGTFALLDQQAALRWVRRNAAFFGGDPRNVTLFGESAGASSTCAQLVSPSAAGLFDRAILESGPCTVDEHMEYAAAPVPLARAEQTGVELATQAGCEEDPGAAPVGPARVLDCLRRLPARALLDLRHPDSPSSPPTFRPAYGTPLLPRSPEAALRSGRFLRVPLLAGVNRDEGRYYAWLQELESPMSIERFRGLLASTFGAAAERIAARYPVAEHGTPVLAWGAVVTDHYFACPALSTQQLVGRRERVFGYEFADRNAPNLGVGAPPEFPLGAYHSAELSYLFDFGPSQLTRAQRRLSDTMIGYWTAFARRGDPNGPGRPRWSASGPDGSLVQRLAPGNGGVRPVDLAVEHQCDFWATIPTTPSP